MLGQHLTVEQQKNRLPLYLQDYYVTRQLDRIEIDGNTIQGYFEYSYLDEKSYFTSPIRSSGGVIDNLNSYATFLTPRLIITYKMLDIESYRTLMQLLQSKNEFSVSCYDIVNDCRVTHNMYFATPSMPSIYQRYLQVLGIKDYTIELIGTNTGVEEYTLTYNYNIPSGISWDKQTTATQTFAKNISDTVGGINAPYTENNTTFAISSQTFNDTYQFVGWYEKSNGTGFGYRDGDAYFIKNNKTLFAKWVASV